MEDTPISSKVVVKLEEIAEYAKKDIINENDFIEDFSKIRDIIRYMQNLGFVDDLKREWLKQENARFLDNLSHAEDGNQFKKVTDDYLHTLSGRVSAIEQIDSYVSKITPVDFMIPEKKSSIEDYLKGIKTVPAHDHRINKFKKEYHLDSLCDLAEFYNKISKENDLFYIFGNINDNLESVLNFSYKKGNEDAKLAEDYFEFINLHKNWKEYPDNIVFKELEKERQALEESKGTDKMINELKEIYSVSAEHAKPIVKGAIDYLESGAYIDDCIGFKNFRDNFEKRINLWKEVQSKITDSDSYQFSAEKVRLMCLEVANEKIYNALANLDVKMKSNGFILKSEIKGPYVDAIEGITGIITGELEYMATGERRYRK